MLRAYNRKKESKLVVGYFGNAHVDAQIHYLTRIANTHTVQFRNEGKGRVHIARPIYLAYTPEDIGAKKRTKKNRAVYYARTYRRRRVR